MFGSGSYHIDSYKRRINRQLDDHRSENNLSTPTQSFEIYQSIEAAASLWLGFQRMWLAFHVNYGGPHRQSDIPNMAVL